MHLSVLCNTIYNNQNKEATWMSIRRGMDKEGMVYIQWNDSHKKNEIMPFSATWMDLEICILSEVCQTAKDKHYIVSFICRI